MRSNLLSQLRPGAKAFMVLTYINQSNGILARLLSSPRAGQVGDLLTAADQRATSSLSHYRPKQLLILFLLIFAACTGRPARLRIWPEVLPQ